MAPPDPSPPSLAFVRRLCPDLPPDEQAAAEEALLAYLRTARAIFERLDREGSGDEHPGHRIRHRPVPW